MAADDSRDGKWPEEDGVLKLSVRFNKCAEWRRESAMMNEWATDLSVDNRFGSVEGTKKKRSRLAGVVDKKEAGRACCSRNRASDVETLG